MEKEVIVRLHKNFEDYAHEKDGVEFWYARELQQLLGYDKWSNFEGVIEKSKIACEMAEQSISDHFADASKTIPMPKGASKEIAVSIVMALRASGARVIKRFLVGIPHKI